MTLKTFFRPLLAAMVLAATAILPVSAASLTLDRAGETNNAAAITLDRAGETNNAASLNKASGAQLAEEITQGNTGRTESSKPDHYTKNPETVRLIHENLERAGINTNPYEYLPGGPGQAAAAGKNEAKAGAAAGAKNGAKTGVMTKAPKGYKPFYISHYGRHGSRSDWAGSKYPWVTEKYDALENEGLLTEEGKIAVARVREIISLHGGMDGRLTQRGQDEHRQIAARMFTNYPGVFKKGSHKVRALSSVAQRCIISMTAFTGELLRREPKLDITWDTGAAFQGICSTEDTREIKKAVNKVLEDQAAEHIPDTAGFYRKLFTDPSKARTITEDPIKLMRYTFDIASIAGSYYMDDRLMRVFSEDDLYWYAQNVAMMLYLRQCNSVEWGDERMKPVQELVDDIVTKADEAIKTGDVAADLRFGHEYQLLAISSRLGVSGVAERLSAETSRDWQGFLYSPFACNLQMIFYKNAKGDVLVKFLLNEREANLITLEGGPYYRWEDVKAAIATAPGKEYAL